MNFWKMFKRNCRRWFGFITGGNLILRYIAILSAVYIPIIVLVLQAGTFGPNSKVECEIPFIYDVTFHFSWGIAIPFFLLYLPWCYKCMDNIIDTFEKCTPPIINENMTNSRSRLGKRTFRCIIGIVFGLTMVSLVGLLNYRSMCIQEKLLWYFPFLILVYFLVITTAVISISIAALAKYID
jgi:hypothetical protein